MKYIAYLILILTIGFNLWLNFPETQILADPNDNIFQYSLVARTNWVWENYGCPLSLSCLPNLVDHNVTTWAEGYPLPFYYPHIPQITIVASYNMLVKPITSIFQPKADFSLYQYYNWTKYLLLALFPLSVFLALKIVGFSPILAVTGAFFASHFSTDGLYGIDPPSFLWRGYGLTSQLYAIFFFPLGIAFTYKALVINKENSKSQIPNHKQIQITKIHNLKTFWSLKHLNLSIIWDLVLGNWSLYLAAIFLTLTTAGHLGIGIISLLSTLPFLFLDLNMKNIIHRGKKMFVIYSILMIILSYWIIPVLLYNNYHMISFWDPIWKFNSYGWYEVIRQFFQGEIFDWQRAPIITGFTVIGFFVLLLNTRLFPFAVLFGFWILMYFGRTTWGGLLDIIPGMKDFHQHRFVVGIHIAALFLIPAGIDYIFDLINKILRNSIKFSKIAYGILYQATRQNSRIRSNNTDMDNTDSASRYFTSKKILSVSKIGLFHNIIFYILSITFISILAYFTIRQTISYANLNNQWIKEANIAYKYDEKNFLDLASYIRTLPSSRIYAGRPGNWGHDFRLGSTQMYMMFGITGFDISQFLPETWSPLSENEQNFDERVAEDFDLLNIKYLVTPGGKKEGMTFPDSAKLIKESGPFTLSEVPTNGWFDVVSSPMAVKTDKTNYINLVHLWHRSYARRWKMHPIISVDNKSGIPQDMQRVISMIDEVNYQENEINNSNILPAKTSVKYSKNIFSDFPFVFPEATVSGKIIKETVTKQTYSATIDVPKNCNNCMIMFKMSYHPDWQVKVDGKTAEKYAVFPFYLATQTTPGIHMVEFYYEPNKLKTFLLIGELILLLILIILILKFL